MFLLRLPYNRHVVITIQSPSLCYHHRLHIYVLPYIQVNIVFHCAATVRFDEDLTKSIGMNVSGVLAIVALAKKMARLEALVDVSTAYCNCDIPNIEERYKQHQHQPKK
jgi:nucleoside-diphosphate-sugar epimerase